MSADAIRVVNGSAVAIDLKTIRQRPRMLMAYRDNQIDAQGRRRFTLYWRDGEQVRGQCYHARPEVYEAEELVKYEEESEQDAARRQLGLW